MQHEWLDPVVNYLFHRVPEEVPATVIYADVFNNDPAIPFRAILLHLQDEGCIYRDQPSPTNIVTHSIGAYALTIPGIAFYCSSTLPAQPYLARQVEQDREKKLARKEAWPKRNWLIISLLTFVLGITSTVIGEALKKKLWPEAKPKHSIDAFSNRPKFPNLTP